MAEGGDGASILKGKSAVNIPSKMTLATYELEDERNYRESKRESLFSDPLYDNFLYSIIKVNYVARN
jgi:hypothetical protein